MHNSTLINRTKKKSNQIKLLKNLRVAFLSLSKAILYKKRLKKHETDVYIIIRFVCLHRISYGGKEDVIVS